MVLRQAALNCVEKVEFVCFILDKISFCFLKKGCPLQEKTALKIIIYIFPSLGKTHSLFCYWDKFDEI